MPLFHFRQAFFLIAIKFCFVSVAFGEVRSMYGFGSVSAGLVGSDRAKSLDGYSVIQNPSLMSTVDKTRLSMGIFGAVDRFNDFNEIVVNNSSLGASSREVGSVSADVSDTVLFQLGIVIPLGVSKNNYRFGLGLALPADKVAATQSQDYYKPQYAMYASDTQRVVTVLGISFEPWQRLSFGLAGHIYATTGASVNLKMPQSPSSSRVNQSLEAKTAVAPSLGLTFQPDEHQSWSLYYSAERDYRLDFDARTSVYLIGSSAPLNFEGTQSLFYDPITMSLGYAREFGIWDLFASIDYENWSRFDGNMVRIKFQTFDTSFVQTEHRTTYKDIFIPRLGTQYRLSDRHVLRGGYSFHPSPVPDLSGPTNFVDSDRHVVGLGHTWNIKSEFLGGTPLKLDTHFQVHSLVPREIRKTNINDVGAPANPSSASGYSIQGQVFSYGLSLTAEM